MGRREPFLYQLVPVVAEVMSRPYPELRESVSRIQTTIKQEEEQFLRNLENGLRLLNDTFQKTKAAGSDTISGKDAFTLHATYGIPVEVVESLATDHNLRIDTAGFEAERGRHTVISRGTTEAAAVFATGPLDTLKKRIPPRQRVRRLPDDPGARHASSASSSRTAWPNRPQADGGSVAGPRPRPNALLRRVGRPGRRHRHDPRRPVSFRGARHQEGKRLHAAHRPGDRGRR